MKQRDKDSERYDEYVQRAEAYMARFKFSLAIDEFGKAIGLSPKDGSNHDRIALSSLLAQRGECYLKSRQYEKAIQDLTESIEIKSDIPDRYECRAAAHFFSKDYQNALQDCNKAIELEPDSFSAFCFRTVIHGELGNIEERLADEKVIYELGPQNRYDHNN